MLRVVLYSLDFDFMAWLFRTEQMPLDAFLVDGGVAQDMNSSFFVSSTTWLAALRRRLHGNGANLRSAMWGSSTSERGMFFVVRQAPTSRGSGRSLVSRLLICYRYKSLM